MYKMVSGIIILIIQVTTLQNKFYLLDNPQQCGSDNQIGITHMTDLGKLINLGHKYQRV